jgi:hypothetical protein
MQRRLKRGRIAVAAGAVAGMEKPVVVEAAMLVILNLFFGA